MSPRPPRVVIVGAGFGGINVAKELARAQAEVLVVDRRNHHLFQPLLYQVATATLSPADIAAPIRKILRRQSNAHVLLGEVRAIDVERRVVEVDAQEIEWDWLVLAAGATHSYFGRPEWEKFAPGLKTIEDATEIRRRFLLAFETAEIEQDVAAREAALTFVIVGGGPTGVELAGSMAEIAHTVIPGDFRTFDAARARILLVEGGPRVLGQMSEASSISAIRQLRTLGVDVRVNTLVTAIDENGVTAGRERIAARNVFWAAGVQASPLGADLPAERDKAGRVLVEPDLSLARAPSVFVIGDLAHVTDPRTNQPVPGVAQGAIQMGRHVGRILAHEVSSRARGGSPPPRPPFRYRDKGTLATIGKRMAVAEVRGMRFGGWTAWILWALVHATSLIQFRNRVFVMLSWFWSYVFYDRGARLITGSSSIHALRPIGTGDAPRERSAPGSETRTESNR